MNLLFTSNPPRYFCQPLSSILSPRSSRKRSKSSLTFTAMSGRQGVTKHNQGPQVDCKTVGFFPSNSVFESTNTQGVSPQYHTPFDPRLATGLSLDRARAFLSNAKKGLFCSLPREVMEEGNIRSRSPICKALCRTSNVYSILKF